MKKLLSVISVVVLSAACCRLAQSAGKSESARIAAKWQMSLETPHGPMQGPLKVQQDGSKLTGTYEIEHIGSMAPTGKVEGDKMSGSTDHAGNWTATRQ